MSRNKILCFLASAALAFVWSPSSHAVVVQLDKAQIQVNGTIAANDDFNDGVAPSGFPYAVTGAFPAGAESGGLLTLNSDWGTLTNNALGQQRQTLTTTLLTGLVNPSNAFTFDRSDRLNYFGIFNLSSPVGPLGNGYGIRFRESSAGNPDLARIVELFVQYDVALGHDVIRYSLQDFVAHTITTLGFVDFAIPNGADQIELQISHAANGDDFIGGYAFGSGGTFDSLTDFATAGQLTSEFYRAQFIAFSALPDATVPEPGGVALICLALGCLTMVRRPAQP
jgi:hypothetical protein